MNAEAPARESVIAFRVTNAESREIDKAAGAAKMDRPGYLRAKVLGHTSGAAPAVERKPKKSHGVASLGSPRLAVILSTLKARGALGATGLELVGATNSLAISTCVSEIRRQLPRGQSISCTLEGVSENGHRIYRYVLHS
jgi:hypothetical protein